MPSHEHKAFIPYSGPFAASESSTSQHALVKAKVASLHRDRAVLDREWRGVKEIPFDYLVIATGTSLRAPANSGYDDKPGSVRFFQDYQSRVQKAHSILIIGGGAVGVQLATDLKELYPSKRIVLVHSRNRLMPVYHQDMHKIIRERFAELGVEWVASLIFTILGASYLTTDNRLILNSRVRLPLEESQAGQKFPPVQLTDGSKIDADLIIPAVGQKPNNELVLGLERSRGPALINPANGFIHVKPTLQFLDSEYSHIFAVGDIADTGAHKAARPGAAQAKVVVKNILDLIEGRKPSEEVVITAPGIHLTLGLVFSRPTL